MESFNISKTQKDKLCHHDAMVHRRPQMLWKGLEKKRMQGSYSQGDWFLAGLTRIPRRMLTDRLVEAGHWPVVKLKF